MATFTYSLALFFFFLAAISMASAQLSSTFYDSSCPNALSTIQSAVKAAVNKEARMGASLLRLHFHDCFVNASIPFTLSFLTLSSISLHDFNYPKNCHHPRSTMHVITTACLP